MSTLKIGTLVCVVMASTNALAQNRSAPPEIHLPDPVAWPGGRIGLSIGPAVPLSDLGDGYSTGFDVRIQGGYELMWGNFGLTPGVAFEYAHFGGQKRKVGDSAFNYIGFLPNVQAALHMWMFAPYLGLGMGFDHFGVTGDAEDQLEAANLDTAGNGFGLAIMFGLDVYFMTNLSAGLKLQVHPGFATLDDGQGGDAGAGFFGIHFGATFAF